MVRLVKVHMSSDHNLYRYYDTLVLVVSREVLREVTHFVEDVENCLLRVRRGTSGTAGGEIERRRLKI